MCGFYDNTFPCMNLVETQQLRDHLNALVNKWRTSGYPGYNSLKEDARWLLAWKRRHAVTGIWLRRPLWVSATIDDLMGHGLALIDLFAEVLGLKVVSLGLMQSPETIIAQCTKLQPAFLGLTVLQFDSADMLGMIRRGIPASTRLIAGGPVFKADTDLAETARVDFAAADAGAFIEYMLTVKYPR